MPVKRVVDVEEIVACPEFISGIHRPSQMRGESRGKLRRGKRRKRRFGILNAERSPGVPADAAPQIVRNEDLAGVQQILGGAEISAGDSGRSGARLKVLIVIETQIGDAVGYPHVGMVAVEGFSDVAVQAPSAVGVQIAAGVDAVA